jgi:hypothetical protein
LLPTWAGPSGIISNKGHVGINKRYWAEGFWRRLGILNGSERQMNCGIRNMLKEIILLPT